MSLLPLPEPTAEHVAHCLSCGRLVRSAEAVRLQRGERCQRKLNPPVRRLRAHKPAAVRGQPGPDLFDQDEGDDVGHDLPATRRAVTLTREQLANRDERMRAEGRLEAAEAIARALERKANEGMTLVGTDAVLTYVRATARSTFTEAARTARDHAVRPTERAVDATEAPAGSAGHPTTTEEPA